MFRIENRHGDRWSNEFGWVEEGYDLFTADEKHRVNLPVGGRWVFECVETTTLPRRPITLNLDENKARARKGTIYRTVTDAFCKLKTTLWGEEVDKWEGRALVYGKEIRVWGWSHRGYIPRNWEDTEDA